MTAESCSSACWAAYMSTATLPSWYFMTGITALAGGIQDSASALVCSFPAQYSTSKSNCYRYIVHLDKRPPTSLRERKEVRGLWSVINLKGKPYT